MTKIFLQGLKKKMSYKLFRSVDVAMALKVFQTGQNYIKDWSCNEFQILNSSG